MAHGKSPRHVRKKSARKKAAAKRRGSHASRAAPVSDETHGGGPVRLQKLLAAAGFGSRRAAEELLRQGRVTVNGRVAALGESADPAVDRIALDGEALVRERHEYWVLHKPVGVVTTASDPEGRTTVLDLLPASCPRLFPVGRLDLETSGLLLLTNDGALAHKLLHPSYASEREYRVTAKGEIAERALERLRRGVHLEDGKTSPMTIGRVHYDADSAMTTVELVLREGRKRQIRRSFLAVGHPVQRLVRTRIGPLRLGRLAKGEVRPLRSDERSALLDYARALEPRRRRR